MNLLTKGDLVTAALRKLAVASDATLTDVEPSSFEDAIFDLEMMMATWMMDESLGIDVGYLFADDGVNPAADDDHGLPTWALKPVIYNLAANISADYVVSPPDTVVSMAQSGLELLMKSMVWKRTPRLKYRNRVPIGSGNWLAKRLDINYFHDNRTYPDDDDTNTTTTS